MGLSTFFFNMYFLITNTKHFQVLWACVYARFLTRAPLDLTFMCHPISEELRHSK